MLWFFLYADCLISSRSFSDRCFCSCIETTFSRILERKGRFDTGRKFFKSLGFSPGFFNRGFTMACLDWGGTAPEQRELFTILVIRGSRLERHSLVRLREVRIGSNMQVLVGDSTVSLRISSSVTGLKRQSLGPPQWENVAGSEGWASRSCQMFWVLFREKHAKSVRQCRTWYVRLEWCGLWLKSSCSEY